MSSLSLDEEIERKRLRALEILNSKRNLQSPLKNSNAGGSSPRFKYARHNSSPISKNREDIKPYTKLPTTKSASEFYGSEKIINANCVLSSEDRFTVELSTFSNEAIALFKTIPTRNYDTKTRLWSFNLRDYETLVQKMKINLPSIVLERLPPFVLNCMKKSNIDVEIDYSRIDPELYNALMPFQLEGVNFGISKNGKCLIADDMGLGKTFQALAIANYFREDWPLLVVTTASMKNIWEETIHKYIPSISIMQTQYMTSAKDYIGDSKVLIVSHDLMSRSLEKLLARNFGVIIIDESHVLKNFKTKVTKAASELAKLARRIVLLSGTPALSRPSELFSQLNLLDDRFFGTFFEYSKRYCDGKKTNFGWDAMGKSNLHELEIVLARKFMIRRTKEDVLKAIPNKVQEVVTLDVDLSEFSEEDQKWLKKLALKYQTEKKGVAKQAALLSFFAESAKIKIPSVCSYILQVLESKKKFLVFAHHQVMLNAIENIIKRKNLKFIRIDGATNSEQRKYFVDKFQLDNEYQCAILSITAANAGITLTAAQLVLFAELHWNPSILSQAESRAHRIGQEHPVFVRYLVAAGTADDSIWPMLQQKQKILGEVGLSKESFQDVAVTKQSCSKTEAVTAGLMDITNNLDITVANTLDITSYFQTSQKDGSKITDAELDEFFDDGMDDIFNNIQI